MRIGGQILRSQFDLLRAQMQSDVATVRLATMQRLNSGSDDPAGLIMATEIRAELAAINAAADNAARAGGVIDTADSALSEVSNLLTKIQGNVVAAANGGLSSAERQALQMETNAALEAINRIGHTTSFAGRALFDGGEMNFALAPDVAQYDTLSMPAIHTSSLGGDLGLLSDLASGGVANLVDGSVSNAATIVEAAGDQVASYRAELGAFRKYTIDAASNMLSDLKVNLTSALGQVMDTDVALETSRLSRAQLLTETSINSLILGQQRDRRLGALLDPLT